MADAGRVVERSSDVGDAVDDFDVRDVDDWKRPRSGERPVDGPQRVGAVEDEGAEQEGAVSVGEVEGVDL